MSFGCTKKEMQERMKRCWESVSEDEGKEIQTCADCPHYISCSDYAEEKWSEAIEKARLSSGRFGKLYLEEATETGNEVKT